MRRSETVEFEESGEYFEVVWRQRLDENTVSRQFSRPFVFERDMKDYLNTIKDDDNYTDILVGTFVRVK